MFTTTSRYYRIALVFTPVLEFIAYEQGELGFLGDQAVSSQMSDAHDPRLSWPPGAVGDYQ